MEIIANMKEIERKWIVAENKMPSLEGLSPMEYERHFIFVGNGIEVRVQKKGNKFEFERKVEKSDLQRTGEKFEITQGEFEEFKKLSKKSLNRQSYVLQTNPEVSLKIYKDKYQGLIRAEVEFESEDLAKAFIPLDWFGAEITNSELGRDAKLVELSDEEFQNLLVTKNS